MRYKYFFSPSTDPYYNLALEQFLAKYVETKVPILFLWQNSDAIIIGRNQDLFSECLATEFENSGGRIARRKSGGGAVYQDLGNLCISVLTSKSSERDLYRELLSAALESLNIKDVFWSGNDLIVRDRKISGSAFYEDGLVKFSHGTILVNCDIRRMDHFLTPSASKMSRHSVTSVASRVMNLCEYNGSITIEKVVRGFLEISDAEAFYPETEGKEFLDLERFFRAPEWIYGRNL